MKDINEQARLLMEAGYTERAIDLMDTFIDQIQFTRALALLSLERWAAGWEAYRYRPTRGTFMQRHPNIRFINKLAQVTKHTAIFGEQGIGDELSFLRWIPIAKQHGYHLPLFCNEKLAPILSLSFRARTGAPDATIREALLMGDLPHIFPLNGIPHPIPIQRTLAPGFIVPEKESMIIGVAWESGTRPVDQGSTTVMQYKHFPIEYIADIVNSLDCIVVIVQRRPDPYSLTRFHDLVKRPIINRSDDNEDLARFAATLGKLDTYVGISSVTTHLLASLRKPIHICVPWPADFRFPGNAETSPWFPLARIHRQTARGDWTQAVNRIKELLQ